MPAPRHAKPDPGRVVVAAARCGSPLTCPEKRAQFQPGFGMNIMKRNAEQKPAASEGVHQVSPGGTCLETVFLDAGARRSQQQSAPQSVKCSRGRRMQSRCRISRSASIPPSVTSATINIS